MYHLCVSNEVSLPLKHGQYNVAKKPESNNYVKYKSLKTVF